MTIPERHRPDVERLPPALRTLLDDELAVGNTIIDSGSHFPAPPAGGFVMLANPVSTRARASQGDVRFYHRNSSQYSGEFHDERRHFFILEAPLPAPPEPDMDAIRAAHATPPAAALASERREHEHPAPARGRRAVADAAHHAPTPLPSPLQRFVDSMQMDYEKWHDGIGYDLEALRAATDEERTAIERTLVGRRPAGWREVEALAALGSSGSEAALRTLLVDGDAEVRTAVVRHAPHLVSDEARRLSIVRGLQEATFYHGLSAVLDDASAFHPSEVVDTLFRETLHGEGEKAVHFAALLYQIHGLTTERFDWEHRPFFLRFGTKDHSARSTAFRELCERLGVDPARYLNPDTTPP